MNIGFPAIPVADWEAQIRTDLKGADFEKRLVWKTPDGLAVRPYYTLESLDGLTIPSDSVPGSLPFVRGDGRPWQMALPGEEPQAQIDASAFHDQGATAVEELALALAAGVEWLAESGRPVEESAPLLIVRFGVGPLIFIEMAKLRAARVLWANAVQAFGTNEPTAAYLRIHAVTARWNKSVLDANNNLLRATAEALAAVAGGADWLTVRPEWIDPHLARNIQLILREESHLDRVADPAGGAWYVEALTDMLAREAWKRFQQIEAEGGFRAWRESGKLDAMLAASRDAKQLAYASRRATLVGVNNYPAVSEDILDVAINDPAWRAAGVFERIRLRTERHVASGAPRPKVLLLEMGDPKMRRARSGFCRNFLGCAGFAFQDATAIEPADLIVLCSSDAEYASLAPRVIAETKAPVVIAGFPKDSVAALEAAGVSGFIHISSNLVETLALWQDRLGVAA